MPRAFYMQPLIYFWQKKGLTNSKEKKLTTLSHKCYILQSTESVLIYKNKPLYEKLIMQIFRIYATDWCNIYGYFYIHIVKVSSMVRTWNKVSTRREMKPFQTFIFLSIFNIAYLIMAALVQKHMKYLLSFWCDPISRTINCLKSWTIKYYIQKSQPFHLESSNGLKVLVTHKLQKKNFFIKRLSKLKKFYI